MHTATGLWVGEQFCIYTTIFETFKHSALNKLVHLIRYVILIKSLSCIFQAVNMHVI